MKHVGYLKMNIFYSLFLITCICVHDAVQVFNQELSQGELICKLVEFKMNEEHDNYIMEYFNVTSTMVSRTKMVLNGLMQIHETIGEKPEQYMTSIEISKCTSKFQEDTCQPYSKLQANMCQELPKDDQMWTNVIESTLGFDPNCPLKPGVYPMKNAPVNLDGLPNLHVLIGSWKIRVNSRDGDKLVTSVIVHLQFMFKRG